MNSALRVQERDRLVLENILDHAIFMLTPEGRVASWSPGAERLTGFVEAEAIGQSLAACLGCEAVELDRLLVTAEGRWCRRKNGEEYWADIAISSIREEDELRGFAVVLRDRSEKKRSEEALRFLVEASTTLAEAPDARQSLQTLADLAVTVLCDWCVVALVEEEGEVPVLVAAAHREGGKVALLTELHRFELGPAGAFGARRVASTGCSELGGADGGAPASIDDIRALAILRELAPSSWMTVPLVVHGRTFGVITFGRSGGGVYGPPDVRLGEDVARRAALALAQADLLKVAQHERLRAEEANQAKDEFLAVVSHELRTPLNAILGWARLLRTGSLGTEKTSRAIDTIERNAKVQTQLIEDLLDVSRIITGRIRLDVRSVDLVSLVEAALESLRPSAEAKGVRIHATLHPDAGPLVGDPDRIAQVVSNLLTNALKFTPAEGRVDVLLERRDGNVVLSVTDTGAGIRADVLPYIFERFRQGPGGSLAGGGLGLGLAIVRHLVALHGGTVTAESDGPGAGSRFVVVLPLSTVTDRAPAARSARGVYARPRLDGLHILVVDDQPDARELIVSLFEEAGARVTTAATAEDALNAVRRERPHVLVSDLSMPGEDGYSLLRRVRELPPTEGGHTPALALSARTRPEDRAQALTAGFQMYVVKPAEPAELLVVVARLAAGADMTGACG